MITMYLMLIQSVMTAGTILWNVVRLIKTAECRKTTHNCVNMRCKWRHSCGRYDKRREILYSRMTYLHDTMILQKEI